MNISEFIKTNGIVGAVFDMDGTLTDSMQTWGEIYSALSSRLNIELPDGFMMKVNHIPMSGRVKEIKKQFSLDIDENEVYSFWVEKAAEYYENVFKIRPYMLETLDRLKASGVKCAIATASDRRCALAFIKSNGLEKYISSVTALDEVSRPKSFPDIYLKAAEKLGVKPSECVVFEDALTALKAAKDGGFKVCGVRDDCSKKDEEQIKSVSDLILGYN